MSCSTLVRLAPNPARPIRAPIPLPIGRPRGTREPSGRVRGCRSSCGGAAAEGSGCRFAARPPRQPPLPLRLRSPFRNRASGALRPFPTDHAHQPLHHPLRHSSPVAVPANALLRTQFPMPPPPIGRPSIPARLRRVVAQNHRPPRGPGPSPARRGSHIRRHHHQSPPSPHSPAPRNLSTSQTLPTDAPRPPPTQRKSARPQPPPSTPSCQTHDPAGAPEPRTVPNTTLGRPLSLSSINLPGSPSATPFRHRYRRTRSARLQVNSTTLAAVSPH